jgi:hypothetical protein
VAHAAAPGAEPHPLQATEDLTAWDPSLRAPGGGPLPEAARRARFRSAAGRAGAVFCPDLVYTFSSYSHDVNWAKCARARSDLPPLRCKPFCGVLVNQFIKIAGLPQQPFSKTFHKPGTPCFPSTWCRSWPPRRCS